MELNVDKIRREIKIRGWSQAEFCRKAGIKPTAFTMLLKSRSTTLMTISKMATALVVDPKELLI